jgi:pimeloyl-ACP methyl ester carboxylesterase
MLHHRVSGNGTSQIVFIHGNSQSHEYWKFVLQDTRLDAQYKLIALDLPGHGNSFRSSDPSKEYALKGLAKSVQEFLSHFEKEPYLLIGCSLGSNMIGEIATELKNCKGFLLTSPCAIGKGLTVPEIIQPNPNLAAAFTAHPTEEAIDQLVDDSAYGLAEELKQFCKTIYKKTDPEFRVSMAECIGRGEYSDELSNLENSLLPVAVVFGEHDKLCFTDYLDKVPFRKWRNKTVLIPDSGHSSMLDQPVALAGIIADFAADCFR